MPLACAEVKCNQKLSIVHRTKATRAHRHLLESPCWGEGTGWTPLQSTGRPPASTRVLLALQSHFCANKVASQHTWQAPRWTGKPKEGRIYYTHNSDVIHTQTRWEVLRVAKDTTRADPWDEYLHILTHKFPDKEDYYNHRIAPHFNKKSMFWLKSCKDICLCLSMCCKGSFFSEK